MFEVRSQVPPGDHWQEKDAAVLQAAGRPNDFFWCRPDIDSGQKNRGWVVKSFYLARRFMKRLAKVEGIAITIKEASGREKT